jgi:hypothetical protein
VVASFKLIVMNNCVPGREAEFHEWYETQHLRDVCAITGVVSAKRYRLTGAQNEGTPTGPWKHAVIYDIETDNLPEVIAEFAARRNAGMLPLSDALAADRLSYFFEEIPSRTALAGC